MAVKICQLGVTIAYINSHIKISSI